MRVIVDEDHPGELARNLELIERDLSRKIRGEAHRDGPPSPPTALGRLQFRRMRTIFETQMRRMVADIREQLEVPDVDAVDR